MSKKSGNKDFAKIDKLRYNEYYDMQAELDELYDKSKRGETFNNLMDLILDERNILLAYRNIKRNSGSLTTGTDGLTIKDCYKNMQQTKLHYVVEFDIKGFFDNVNHSKLIRQIWALGIRDKKLIYIIRQMLKAPIKHENGILEIPKQGTPQGGV